LTLQRYPDSVPGSNKIQILLVVITLFIFVIQQPAVVSLGERAPLSHYRGKGPGDWGK
jgi:hypothetical protein